MPCVIAPDGRLVGCTVGNDMSSRDIEGENLLYLPQAKVYDRSCALGPWIVLGSDEAAIRTWRITIEIRRGDAADVGPRQRLARGLGGIDPRVAPGSLARQRREQPQLADRAPPFADDARFGQRRLGADPGDEVVAEREDLLGDPLEQRGADGTGRRGEDGKRVGGGAHRVGRVGRCRQREPARQLRPVGRAGRRERRRAAAPGAGDELLLTGTGIVPDESFTLAGGDAVAITIDGVGALANPVVVV